MAVGMLTQPWTKTICPAVDRHGGVVIEMGGVSSMAGGFSGSSARAVKRRPRRPRGAASAHQVGGRVDSRQRLLHVPPAAAEHRVEVFEIAAGKAIAARPRRGKALTRFQCRGKVAKLTARGYRRASASRRWPPPNSARSTVSKGRMVRRAYRQAAVEIAGRQPLIAQLQALLRGRQVLARMHLGRQCGQSSRRQACVDRGQFAGGHVPLEFRARAWRWPPRARHGLDHERILGQDQQPRERRIRPASNACRPCRASPQRLQAGHVQAVGQRRFRRAGGNQGQRADRARRRHVLRAERPAGSATPAAHDRSAARCRSPRIVGFGRGDETAGRRSTARSMPVPGSAVPGSRPAGGFPRRCYPGGLRKEIQAAAAGGNGRVDQQPQLLVGHGGGRRLARAPGRPPAAAVFRRAAFARCSTSACPAGPTAAAAAARCRSRASPGCCPTGGDRPAASPTSGCSAPQVIHGAPRSRADAGGRRPGGRALPSG